MKYIRSKLFYIQIAVQLLAILLFLVFSVSEMQQAIICGILLCTVGIPHGANDYLFNKDKSKVGLLKFLILYIGIMGLYLAVWWWFPILALVVFFLVSFHHFGQSNFENDQLFHLPSLIWGLWILIFPVLLHYKEAISIFKNMVNLEDALNLNQTPIESIQTWQIYIALILALIYLISVFKTHSKHFVLYTFQFIAVSIWYLITPLLFGFIVVFCLWHALQSMRHQSIYYRENFSAKRYFFFKAMIPFSLLALLLFIAYVYFFGFKVNEAFILLSLITLPHVLVMHKLYKPQ
jgi:Brp/Blh family beta-carotene 15,15'-monooxygenase